MRQAVHWQLSHIQHRLALLRMTYGRHLTQRLKTIVIGGIKVSQEAGFALQQL